MRPALKEAEYKSSQMFQNDESYDGQCINFRQKKQVLKTGKKVINVDKNCTKQALLFGKNSQRTCAEYTEKP